MTWKCHAMQRPHGAIPPIICTDRLSSPSLYFFFLSFNWLRWITNGEMSTTGQSRALISNEDKLCRPPKLIHQNSSPYSFLIRSYILNMCYISKQKIYWVHSFSFVYLNLAHNFNKIIKFGFLYKEIL